VPFCEGKPGNADLKVGAKATPLGRNPLQGLKPLAIGAYNAGAKAPAS